MSAKTVSQLHKQGHADYDIAKKEIHQALGNISSEQVWGRQVLCAVYVRPNCTTLPNGTMIWVPTSSQEEDIWQGKALLVLALGPSAFKGDESYIKATFPDMANLPKVGDWLYARPNDGIAMSVMGDGASRPQGTDHLGRPVDKFDWDGWPCRILQDESFFGKMTAPHKIV